MASVRGGSPINVMLWITGPTVNVILEVTHNYGTEPDVQFRITNGNTPPLPLQKSP